MAPSGPPPAEVDVTTSLVRALLAEQHPDLVDLDLALVAHGWDNAIVRVGPELAARVPRRLAGAELVEHEQRWLPRLAPRLPLPIPAPVRVGRPGVGFPWCWSIVPWFDGDVAADVPPDDAGDAAQRIGDLLATLHVEAPSDAPHNPYRGVAVSTLRGRFEERLPDVAAMIDVAAVARRWETVTEADVWTGPATWIHGDLHTANVLVRDGEIHAVIDWGDLAAGDPACDLAIGWMLFDDDDDRDRFRRAAGRHLAVDDATWLRAQAWGLYFAVMYLAHSADSPRFERMGRSLLGRLLVEPDGH